MKEQKLKAVEFYAYIPPVATAIAFGDDIARIKLDIPTAAGPECCIEQAKAMVDFQGKKLKVLVEVLDE